MLMIIMNKMPMKKWFYKMMNKMIILTQMELIMQDDEYDEKKSNLAHMSCIITFELNQFECVLYKHMLILFI